MNAFDGSGREVVARGVRSSVGMDINLKDMSVWFTDNQSGGMGDETRPGELKRVSRTGEHVGYPLSHGNNVQIADTAAAAGLKDMKPPANWTKPQVKFPAHQAQLGMTFYGGKQFPEKCRGRRLRCCPRLLEPHQGHWRLDQLRAPGASYRITCNR